MTTQEMIAVLSAFEQGKKIECIDKYMKDEWEEVNNPSWNFRDYNYRIVEEPEYVPYDGTQEGTLVGKIVISKSTSKIKMITGEDKLSEEYNVMIGDNEWESYEYLNKYYKFLDETPCGMLK